jgi:hypothetical protein
MLKRTAALIILVLTGAPLAAQGLRTGSLTGIVTAEGGDPLPGVTVTVASAALQGTRTTTSDAHGAYILKGLPPGTYTVTFAHGTLSPVEQKVDVTMGELAKVDARIGAATRQEQVDVTARGQSVVGSAQGGVTYKSDEIDLLPVGRDPVSMAALAPGLTTNTPNGGQVSVGGGFGYDNVFLVDGVDINDNVFGSPDNLYIEEAMEETQVLTSGIPAEFGRFAGGAVNVVSKKGGNRLSGSLRTDLADSSWRSATPFEKEEGIDAESRLSKVYQGTLGGPAVKDRLWFFGAMRRERSSYPTQLDRTALPYVSTLEDERYSLKATGKIADGHTIESSYLRNSTDSFGPPFSFTIDPKGLSSPRYPSDLFVASYNGVLREDLFAELQYSRKHQGFRDAGGTSEAIEDSPFITVRQSLAQYNAPYFDSNDPEDRNNRQITGSLSHYLTTKKWGRHDLKAGFEHFTTSLVGGNSPSSTSFVFFADYKANETGRPILDANNNLIPQFEPGVSSLSLSLADRGAQLDIRTLSFFLEDRVVLSNRWSFDLGMRYERVRSKATGGIVGVDTDTVVPRLAASFTPDGQGRWVVSASYGQYAGKYNESQFGQNTTVGNPESYHAVYVGPRGEGRNFAPGFNPDNYVIVGGTFPTANVFFDKGLSSPIAREVTLSAGRQLGVTTFVKATVVDRRIRRFVEDFITIDGGFTRVNRQGLDFGNFDNQIFRNSDEPQRRYRAVELMGRHRFTDGWLTEGSYTLQLKNEGNFEGEAVNQPALTSTLGDYPEMLVPDRNFPVGRLAGFQRHKARVWSRYRLGLGRAGNAELGVMWRFDSALTYSLGTREVPLSAIQESRDPGYQRPPTTQTLFFGARGSQDFEPLHLFDAAFTYTVPLWRSVKTYVKLEAFNIFKNEKLVTWETQVLPDDNGPKDANGLPTTYIKSPSFGLPTGNYNYPAPREFAVSMGFRF